METCSELTCLSAGELLMVGCALIGMLFGLVMWIREARAWKMPSIDSALKSCVWAMASLLVLACFWSALYLPVEGAMLPAEVMWLVKPALAIVGVMLGMFFLMYYAFTGG